MLIRRFGFFGEAHELVETYEMNIGERHAVVEVYGRRGLIER